MSQSTLKYPMPKFVKVLLKSSLVSDELRKIYDNGGMDPEPEFLAKDKKLKRTMIYVSSFAPKKKTEIGKGKYGFNQSSGNWIYCGQSFFVRKIGKVYECARYMAYETTKDLTEPERFIEPWDDEKYA